MDRAPARWYSAAVGDRADPYNVQQLPQRGINLLAAREVQRALVWHRKMNRGAPGAELFEQLVLELEAEEVIAANLRRLGRQFAALYEPLPGGFPRFAAVDAESICRAAPETRGTASSLHASTSIDCWWMPRDLVRKDAELWTRARAADVRALCSLSANRLAKARARDLGPLWPGREPHWLAARRPTLRELRRRDARMWQEDRPAWHVRGGRGRKPSPALPRELREALAPGPFELAYVIEREYVAPRKMRDGTRVVGVIRPAASPATMTLIGRHRFRGPAEPERVERFAAACGGARALAPLVRFYRAHDGALLFQPDGEGAAAAHAEIVGLRDQAKARRILRYDLQSRDVDDPEQVPRVFAKAGLTPATAHVIGLLGGSTLVIDLGRKQSGRVLTYGNSGFFRPFAPDFSEAVRKLSASIARLSGRAWIPLAPTGEGEAAPLARLRSVRRVGSD